MTPPRSRCFIQGEKENITPLGFDWDLSASEGVLLYLRAPVIQAKAIHLIFDRVLIETRPNMGGLSMKTICGISTFLGKKYGFDGLSEVVSIAQIPQETVEALHIIRTTRHDMFF
ncbi:hypothetical protein ACJX0J_022571, partial [Zea mays]